MKRLTLSLFLMLGCTILWANLADELIPLSQLETPALDEFLAKEGLHTDDFPTIHHLEEFPEQFQDAFYRRIYRNAFDRNHVHHQELIDYVVYTTQGKLGAIRQFSTTSLGNFEQQSFSSRAVRFLENSTSNELVPSWFILLGAANTPSSIPYAQAILGHNNMEIPDWLDRWEWGAHLILARNGDEDSIRYVIDRITSRPNWLFTIAGAPRDLMYLNQPEVVELFVEMLFSDGERPHSLSGFEPEQISFYGAYYLNRMLDDFPEDSYGIMASMRLPPEKLQNLRDWVRNHEGPWKIRDQRHTLRSEEWKLANLPGYGEEDTKPQEVIEEDSEPEREQDENSFAERAPAAEPEQPQVDEESPSGSVWPWLIMGVVLVVGGALIWSRRKQ